ncbi:hypothetical protein PUR43_27425, partial [Enterobacter hormaechei subsp. xiangfangensis]
GGLTRPVTGLFNGINQRVGAGAAGYGAELSHPKAKPLAESSSPSEALTAATPELPVADDIDDSQQLLI